MNTNVKYVMSSLVIISFIFIALAQTSSDTKGRKFNDEFCRTLDEAVTYEADIYTSVINKNTLEPVPGVEITIKVYHYEAVRKLVDGKFQCEKKLILNKKLTELTNEHGVVTFRPGTFIFVHELDMVEGVVEAYLNDIGYHSEIFWRNHQNISGVDVTFEVLNKESL
ncbi:MAG: hypothetical protein HKN68_11015 [Saprospiraceae bacterium]|nr:hypothetical protein [Saprospiraceae bacterium]